MTRQADAQVPGRRYDGTAIALHWITAILIVANLTLGLSMVGLPISPRKLHWYLWHKSIGVTIFVLTSARLFWRVRHRRRHAVPMPRWQQGASALSHGALYALLFLIPVSGYLYSSATGVQVVWLGLVRCRAGPEGQGARRCAQDRARDAELAARRGGLYPCRSRGQASLLSNTMRAAADDAFRRFPDPPRIRWPADDDSTIDARSGRGRDGAGDRAGRHRCAGQERDRVHDEADGRQFRRPLQGVESRHRLQDGGARPVEGDIDIDLASLDLASADSEAEALAMRYGSIRRNFQSRISRRRRSGVLAATATRSPASSR